MTASPAKKLTGRGGAGRGQGRKKRERPTDAGVAERVLRKQKAEELWNEIIETDAQLMRDTRKTAALREDLHYLEDRFYGKSEPDIPTTNPSAFGLRVIIEHIGRPNNKAAAQAKFAGRAVE